MQTENINSASEIKRRQQRAIKVSMAGSIILFHLSAAVGMAIDSITLILDAAASFVMIAMAFLMYVAIDKIHRPADKQYNFGYGKYEPLTATIQGVLIIASSVFAIKFAVQDIIHADNITNSVLPVITTFVASILGVCITIYLKRTARNTGSAMLKAAGLHWLMDTALSFGICFGFCIGLFLQRAGYSRITPYVDPIMAIILALVLLRDPIKTVAHNAQELLDAVPASDIHDRIRKVADASKFQPLGVHRIRARKAGQKIFLEIIFTSKNDITLAEVKTLTDTLEKDIQAELGNCDIVTSFKPHTS